MKILIFDTEAKKLADEVGGFDNAHLMGVSAIGTWRSDTTMYRIFLEADMSEFIKLANESDVIVGYNHLDYDYNAMSTYMNVEILRMKRNIDLIEIVRKVVKKRYSLDHVASQTLGFGRDAGDGRDAVQYYKDGNYPKLFTYLLDNVQLTVKLFYHMMCYKNFKVNGAQYPIPPELCGVRVEENRQELFDFLKQPGQTVKKKKVM